MMRGRYRWLIFWGILLSIPGCTPVPTPFITPTLIPTPQLLEDPGFNLLVVVEGNVMLKRNGWSDFHPASFGTVVHRGDLLHLGDNAKAAVLCDDLSLWPVPAGTTSGLNGCKLSPEPLLETEDGLLNNTRASGRLDIPFIISPRMTKLLTSTPMLRWNPVPGVSRYGVQIQGDEFLHWETEVTSTEIAFPGTPPMEPGVSYLLLVTADTGTSSRDEGIPGLGFSILPESESLQVLQAQSQLEMLDLSDDALPLALAHLYVGHDLYAEAIEFLEKQTKTGNHSAAVYRLLGDLYFQIALPQLAEGYFLKSENLAKETGDIEGQVLAQTGLVMAYAALGNIQEADRWLDSALKEYAAFGEPANQLAERLGSAYLALANLDEAIQWWHTAQQGYKNIGDIERASILTEQIGNVYANMRQLDEAVLAWSEAWEGYHVTGDLQRTSELAERLGETYATLDQNDLAVQWLSLAQKDYENLGNSERSRQLINRIEELGQTP